MNNNATKGDMDKEIMNIFEEQEDKFSFPITSQKEARDFVKLLNKHGCSYEIISKEVDEDVERFRDWRLGGGSLEIGKNVLDRINRPFRDTMFSESENDDKDRRNSLNDFYQFSFDEEEVLTTLSSKTPKIEISAPAKATDTSNLPIDKSKTNLSPNHSTQTNISSAPKEIVTSQHQSSNALTTSTKVEASKCSAKVSQPANATVVPVEIKKCAELPSLSDKPKNTTSSHDKPQGIKANQPDSSKDLSNTQAPLVKTSVSATSQNDIKLPPSKQSPSPSLPTPQPANLNQSSSHSQSAKILTSSQSATPQTTAPKSPTSQTTSPKQSTSTNKESSASTEEERPPSPITTSPHYQPYAASFTADDIENMLNYNSDDQNDKANKSDVAGFVYVFSDIPSPTMKVNKHTKFRVKVGTSKDPLKRLQQALHFNPDVRMLASIPIGSRNSCKSMLKESLKLMLMRNRVDWYWATLNAIFAAIDEVLQKCPRE